MLSLLYYPAINFKYVRENNDDSIICIDSDNFYQTNILQSQWDQTKNTAFTFLDNSQDAKFSYVQVNETNQITDIL